MKYRHLTENQLIAQSNKNKLNNSDLNIEWRRRYGLQYPYKLHESGAIINCVMGAFVGDREMDQLILEQAKRQRQILKRDKGYVG